MIIVNNPYNMVASKRIVILSILALLVLAGLFIIVNYSGRIAQFLYERKLQAEIKEIERPYREDIYGGVTPEETYALFIKALKEGNIELATKYFSPKRQGEWLKELQAQKAQNTLGEFLNKLPKLENLNKLAAEQEYVEYARTDSSKIIPEEKVNISGQEVVIPSHSSTIRIIFYKNTFTNKWKIENL